MTHVVKDEIIELLTEHGVFAEPEVVDHLAEQQDPLKYCEELLSIEDEPPLFLNLEVLGQLEDTLNRKRHETEPAGSDLEPIEEMEGLADTEEGETLPLTGKGLLASDFDPLVMDIQPEVEVIRDITNRSTCEGDIKDFTHYFMNRYHKLKKLLRNRIEMKSTTSIEYLKEKKLSGEVKVIGMVSEVRSVSWGGLVLTVEDDTAEVKAIYGAEEPVVKDEIIGLIGKYDERKKLIRCKSIVRPGLATSRTFKRADEPVFAMFISDIHLGSTTFLHKPWRTLIRWLNGHIELQKHLAGKVKYIIVNGDIVDGIGIYPGQEAELDIKDIYAQYEEIGRQFSDIPEHIEMIILPGNHDAVRPAEPQPTFPKEITKLFPKNCRFVGNPSTFSLHGVEVLAYHGRSMDDLIPALKLNYEKPMEVMKMMLHMRHLAPIYGERTPIAPEREDIMVIDKVPDIFVTGHLHKTDVRYYRNVLMIQASAWQSQTSFQKMMNIQPDPAKAIVVDLQTLSAKKLNFSG